MVYRIPCKDCNAQYIGEKGRALGTRQSEHERAVRLEHVEKSALVEHVKELDHTFAWNEVSVLRNESR